MEIQPRGEPEIPEVPHRRRQLSTWQKTPKWVKISVAVCAVLVLISIATGNSIINWAQNRFWSTPTPVPKPRVTPGQAFDEVASKMPAFDLELSGTKLNPATRRIEGTVFNKSDRIYTDIKIMFALPSRDLAAQDSTTVTVARLPPGARAKFASDVVPKGSSQWALVNTTGTPVK